MKKFLCLFFLTLNFVFSNAQSITQQWATRYSGTGDNTDKINAQATDGTTSIYYGGYTYRTFSGRDFLLIKLNMNGDTQWVRTMNGPNNGNDEIVDLAYDAAGFIYTAGTVKGIGTGKDIRVVKYNTNGDTIWTRTYNYSANQDDAGVACALTSAGNIVVTGTSDQDASTAHNYDIVTIAYDASGVQLWLIRFNGANSFDDRATGIAVSGTNIAVCGRSEDASGVDDYITIYYNNAGVQQWSQLFAGVGGGVDRASSVAFDAAGAVVTTGRSDNGTDDDFITVKYNATGIQQWSKTFDNSFGNDRAVKVLCDASNNVYVTGQTFTGLYDDVELIKYTSTGAVGYSASFNSTNARNDRPVSMFLDASNNVYICGFTDISTGAALTTNYDMLTLKYNSTGTFQWSKTKGGTRNNDDAAYRVWANATGTVYTAGTLDNTSSLLDASWIQYNAAGIEAWTKQINGLGDYTDKVIAITYDGSGYAYSTGYTMRSGNDRDYCTIKYNSIGDTLWMRTYDGTGDNVDEGVAIKVDAAGNVYVTGFSDGVNGNSDIVTIKYSSIGDSLWVRRYAGISDGNDQPCGLLLDASGNIYVGGYVFAGTAFDNLSLIKYSPAGVQQFATLYNNTTGNGDDRGLAMTMDATPNFYLTGRTFNGTNSDYVTVKFSSAGAVQWHAEFDGGAGDDQANAITVDAPGNVYVAGQSDSDPVIGHGNNEYVTVKYNSSGAEQWHKTFAGAVGGDDVAVGVGVLSNGTVVVTGFTDTNSDTAIKDYDWYTQAYDNSGTATWNQQHTGPATSDDKPAALVIDGYDNIIITGGTSNGTLADPDLDMTTLAYNPAGTQMWSADFNGPDQLDDDAFGLAVNTPTEIYIGGYSSSTSGQRDFMSIKYNYQIGIRETDSPVFTLNFSPNPATEYSILRLNGFEMNNKLNLTATNLVGKTIPLQFIVEGNSILIERNLLSSGIYLISVTDTNGITATGKLTIQ